MEMSDLSLLVYSVVVTITVICYFEYTRRRSNRIIQSTLNKVRDEMNQVNDNFERFKIMLGIIEEDDPNTSKKKER